MKYEKLGNTELEISSISLGTWAFGNSKRWDNDLDEKKVKEILHRAVDLGINTIDTAIIYGTCEEIVGRALKGLDRDKLIVVSKCGSDPDKIEDYIDISLKRMDLDYLDMYLVHMPSHTFEVEDTIAAMEKIKNKGKTRYIGVSNYNVEQLKRALSVTEIAINQSPYNILWRELEHKKILDFCIKNNIGIMTYSSLGQGFLAGQYRKREDLPQSKDDVRNLNCLLIEENFDRGMEVIELLDKMAEKYNCSLADIALNWVTNQKGITTALVGAEKMSHLEDSVKASDIEINKEDLGLLGEKGFEISKIYDYSCTMFGMKYDQIKVDEEYIPNIDLEKFLPKK